MARHHHQQNHHHQNRHFASRHEDRHESHENRWQQQSQHEDHGKQNNGHDATENGRFQVFTTDFTALNNSGVSGGTAIVLDKMSHTVTVEVDATGLTPNQVHPQHIHGFFDDSDSKSPTLAQDADHDGFVELAEGQTTYGPILLDLSLMPQLSANDDGTPATQGAFPTADANGNLHYNQTFHFDFADPNSMAIFNSIENLTQKEVVLHGETVAAGSGAGTNPVKWTGRPATRLCFLWRQVKFMR